MLEIEDMWKHGKEVETNANRGVLEGESEKKLKD